MRYVLSAARVLATLAVVVAAGLVGRWLWLRSEADPWTRDGKVRADIVEVTPDVSGLVTQVFVSDNQPVRRGQLLFVIDRPRYQLALAQAQSAVAFDRSALQQAEREDRRNHALGELVTTETVEEGGAKVQQLKATLTQAIASRDLAGLNLHRTAVTASVNGVVTNMEMRPGDYVVAGRSAMALVYQGSLHVDGYFEETKLPAVRIGDRAHIRLMGVGEPALGHVESIAGGIEDRERAPGGDLLANVNPTFSWVRLPQRIPVRIAIDKVPAGLRLIPGSTATVIVLPSVSRPIIRRSLPW